MDVGGYLSASRIYWKQFLSVSDSEEITNRFYFFSTDGFFAAGYAVFKEMIGMAKSDRTDASVNHDDVIYELQSKL